MLTKAISFHSKELQQSVNKSSLVYQCSDLTVKVKKAPNTILLDFDISDSDTPLEQVEHFPYRSSLLLKKKAPQKMISNTELELHPDIWKANKMLQLNCKYYAL